MKDLGNSRVVTAREWIMKEITLIPVRNSGIWKQQDHRCAEDKERHLRAQRTPLPADPTSTDCPERAPSLHPAFHQ